MAKTITMRLETDGSKDKHKRDRRTEKRMRWLKRHHNLPSMIEMLRASVDYWYDDAHGGR